MSFFFSFIPRLSSFLSYNCCSPYPGPKSRWLLRLGVFTSNIYEQIVHMSQITTLIYLLLVFLLREIRPLGFYVLLTLTFIFLTVSLQPIIQEGSLTSSLVFFLYLIVGCYISTYSLLVFFIMYELSLFPVCLLIILFGYQPEKIKSMFYLLLYTVVCSAPFLYFIIAFNGRVRSGFSALSAYTRILVCLSFMVKSPMYTLHS